MGLFMKENGFKMRFDLCDTLFLSIKSDRINFLNKFNPSQKLFIQQNYGMTV